MNYEAAKQFFEREGHLQVPRKHIERIVGEDQEEREHKLGAWISNQRSRAATLTPERMEHLSAIGIHLQEHPQAPLSLTPLSQNREIAPRQTCASRSGAWQPGARRAGRSAIATTTTTPSGRG